MEAKRKNEKESGGHLLSNMKFRVCVVCGKLYKVGRFYTCSEGCHERFVDGIVEEFGESKRIVDAVTGTAYKVPTREVLERGLRHEDLKKYPKWKEP